MEPMDIEKIATDACFAINYEIKSKAQQKFYSICSSLSQIQIQQLMNNYSEVVLFVTMQFVYKIIPTIKDQRFILVSLNESAQRWYNTNNNATLIRNDGRPLTTFVENSVGRTIGQCLKYIYLQKEFSDWVVKFIKQRVNLRYRLYLWKLLISTVSTVDNDLTFLVYRSMVYNFQQNVIPEIMDSLLPYFQSVKEEIQINDLAFMQSHLSVSDKNGIENGNSDISLFNPGEVKFTDLVFQVLKQVICFNYNITYSQFQSQIPIDNCLVCFPDPVTKKVANKQFLSSIFFVAQKLINDTNMQQAQNSTFLIIALQCIQKIMLTKLFYTSSQIKNQFIKTVLICMTRLLSSSKLNQTIILSLVESNLKFLINIELYQIKNHTQEYMVWIQRIRVIVLGVVTNSSIHIQNQLVTQCLELTAKIMEQATAPQMKQDTKMFKQFGIEVAGLFFDKLFWEDTSLIGNIKNRNYDQLQKNISSFLKRARQLACLNFEKTYQKLQPLMFNILKTAKVNSISNVLLLLAQFSDGQVLQRNILYEPQQTGVYVNLGKMISMGFQWIESYRSQNQMIQLIQISILLFMKKFLTQMLAYFSYEDNHIKLTSQIYKSLIQAKFNLDPQTLLAFCYSEIARHLMMGDYSRSSYTFQILTTLLLKFKWGLRREHFRQTTIARQVLNQCKQLSQISFKGEMMMLRKQLYKIITNISFDDILDDYRNNINQLVANLEKCLNQNRWKAMYDLTGICEAIDTSVIYRYLMITLEKSNIRIPNIMNQLFSHVEEASVGNPILKIELVKSILKLQHSMIENKGQRLAGSKNIFYNYKLIGYLMPYWAQMLSMAQMSNEGWDQVIIQMYKIFNTLLKNNNTNFFILERTIPQYQSFLGYMLANMINTSAWVDMYPSLFTQHRTSMQLMSKQLMEVIFCNQNEQIVKLFNQLLNIYLKFHMKGIQLLNEGNKAVEENLQTYFQIIKSIFKYLRNAKRLEHKKQQLQNIMKLNEEIEVKYEYVIQLFKFGISCGKKQPRTLDNICKIIHSMDFLARSAMGYITSRIGLAQNHKTQLLRIWAQNEQNKGQFGEQFEDTEFLINIKQWFKKCDTSTLLEPDY